MGKHIEILRVVAGKYEKDESFKLNPEHDKNIFWYADGKVSDDWGFMVKEGTNEFLAETYQFYIQHLETTWDCQLQYEIEHRGIEDSIAHDADKLIEIYKRHAPNGNPYVEFLIAYSVTTSTTWNNYGDKDFSIEYELLGEVDLSKLNLATVPS